MKKGSSSAQTRYAATITIPRAQSIDYKKVLGESKGYERSTTEIEENVDTLDILIKSKDIGALRSAINAMMRDLQVIEGAGKE